MSITAILNLPQSQETFAEHFRGRLCGAGKNIFVNTDEAKYNDYVIYNTPSGTDETPSVPPVTP